MKENISICEKNKNVFTKDMLIKSISKECGKKFGNIRREDIDLDILRSGEELGIVRGIYNIFEKYVKELIASADNNNDVVIKLFEGVTIDSKFIPQKTKLNNLTGEVATTASKIKPSVNFTRSYRDKLTNYNT